jgi:hypothetical protein
VTGRAGAVAWLALAASACGHAMFVPPAGPGVPAANAADAWASATSACRQSQNYKAILHVSGRAGDERLWPLAVETALTSDGAIYMSATTSGQSIFVLSGTAKESTLWLRREDRAVVAPPGAIIESMLGVALPPDRLLSVLTGCITRTFDVTSSAQHNSILAIHTSDARVYLEQLATGWRARAGDVDGFSVELGRKGSPLPENVWIRTAAGRSPQASLDVKVSEAETNSTIPASFFAPPPGAARAQPMKLEELRFSGGKDRGSSPR